MRQLIKLGFVVFLAGCMTTPKPEIMDSSLVPKMDKPTCIGIDFMLTELDFSNEVKEIKYGSSNDFAQLKAELKFLNLNTDCASPVRRYKVTTGHRTPNMILRIPWMMLSVATVGIIPYFGTLKYHVGVENESGSELLNEVMDSEETVWIGFLPKVYRNEEIASKNYNTSVGRANLIRPIALAIKNDLEKRKP